MLQESMTEQKSSPQGLHKVKQRTLLGVWVMAFILAAGSVGPTNAKAVPDEDVSHALAQWWERFDDPLLNALVTQALQTNTSLRSARAALQQARALRDVKSAGLQPSLSASGSAGRSKATGTEAGNSFGAKLDAQWMPDVFGGDRSALEAADQDALASEATLADAQGSVAAEVALAYIALRGQQAQSAIAQTNLASQEETLQITDWRAQAGLTTSLEVEQARTAAAQTRAQIPMLLATITKAESALSVLTGQLPQALKTQLSPAQAVPQVALEKVMIFPADTLRQRPDVRAAEHRITAALARVSVAEAALYPSFSISGSLGLNALTLAGLTSGASALNSLLAGISVPLFDAGATQAQVRSQEAALEQTRANYQGVVLTALKEVQDALETLSGDNTRLLHLQTAAESARLAALLAQNRYTSGLIDFQTVLLTQRTLLTAQDNVASTTADVSADHVRLYKALGGGWNPALNLKSAP
jgi:NodT family efflux transporter outer membrane factor (OMF) lipoprotein